MELRYDVYVHQQPTVNLSAVPCRRAQTGNRFAKWSEQPENAACYSSCSVTFCWKGWRKSALCPSPS